MKRLQPHRWAVVAIAAVGLVFAAYLHAGSTNNDWPQFRGQKRDGVSRESGLLKSWPEGGPKEVWRVPLGEGYSGIVVVGKRLYTMYSADIDGKPTEVAGAFNAETGEELWNTPMGERYDNQFGNGPRSTPTVDGDTVFALDSRGELVALSTKDGSARWRVSFTETFGSKVPHFGYSTSALVDGKNLLVQTGAPEGKSYVALDKKTGELRWSIGDEPAGYNSTLVLDTKAGRRFVHVVRGKVRAVDGDGKEIWSHEWPRGETHAMPTLVSPNRIFLSGAEGVGGVLLEIDGDSVKEVWTTRFMRNHFSSSIVHGDHIYGFDNATLKSIAVADAELGWAKRGLGKGSLILADDQLIVLSDRGELLLIDASARAYQEKGRVQALEDRCWTSPTLSDGRLYLRNHAEMVAYDLKG